MRAEGFLEYLACLPTAAVYNVNRGRSQRFIQPRDLMSPRHHRSAAAPSPAMRYARPGERPPSRLVPGESDGVIERFDAWNKNHG
jgi:hypothetical protein